ncbi:MAG: ATP-dependent helicase HrpB [Planctomycetota bacterium]
MADLLPIHSLQADLLASLRETNRAIVTAPTGSGKSTQVPQMLLRNGFLDAGQVVVLQPRRLAARLLAARVAEELGVPLGAEVGYQVRFDDVTGPRTRIRFVTEGILLRQAIEDPSLRGVSVVIFDEFHERHLYSDVTLARALDLQERGRPDLRVLVMSATLDVDRLEAYLRPCARLHAEGRTHPVTIEYAEPRTGASPPVWEQAAGAFARHVRGGGAGDALVFMPGAFEIARTIEALQACKESEGYLLLPLHGELPPRDQDLAVARHERPKVIVSTNVAETSLTIDGIRLVIDSGLARVPGYDAGRGINTLFVQSISRASADQRAGRAGRTAPGTCIRLWGERDHARRSAREVPEVSRVDLCETVLALKACGVADLRAFRWLDAPPESSLRDAEELLTDLGALRPESGGLALTDRGRRMLAFPLHPRYARMLLAAGELGCVREAALAAALTQGRDLLLRGADGETLAFRDARLGQEAASDFLLLVRAWQFAARNDFRAEACRRIGVNPQAARQVGPLFDRFLSIARRQGLEVIAEDAPEEAFRRCILIGFSDRVGRRAEDGAGRCRLVHGRSGVLARESVVQDSPFFVAAEVRELAGRGKSSSTVVSLVTAIDPEWLTEFFPEDMNRKVEVRYDSEARRVAAEEQVRFRDLVLERRRVDPPPADEAARLLAEEVLAGRMKLDEWTSAVDQWILRLEFLCRTCPELDLPSMGEAGKRAVVEDLCHGASAYRDLKSRPVLPRVRGWLGGAQQELVEKHAPDRLVLSNGRKVKVTYEADSPPHVAARIQELYGVTQVPRVAMGRVPLVVHLLAPNMRPVQVTQDLAGFWREHYPRVKRELQRRYPRHEWRDLPP